MSTNKTIMVAPLHWGLGHATRCIPIIRALLQASFDVLLASDGGALLLLRKEFPSVPYVELPSYNISYPKNRRHYRWKLLSRLPHIYRTMLSEKKIVAELVSKGSIDGIISDNRFGIHSPEVPSVFITHQLTVLSGSTTYFSSYIHRRIIKKFDECWIPDTEGAINLSGKLGHIKKSPLPIKYIGPLNRMQIKKLAVVHDILVIISGPEPQRSLFEDSVYKAFEGIGKNVLIVQGIVEKDQNRSYSKNVTVVNFMTSEQLEEAINKSAVIISRSGYSSIMDLVAIGKRVFFVPTPGQYEQQYLANRLQDLGIAPFCQQQDFSFDKLSRIEHYKGFSALKNTMNLRPLFRLFKSE